MREGLVNCLQGFEHSFDDNLVGITGDMREMVEFWMWRVAGVQIDVNLHYDNTVDPATDFNTSTSYVAFKGGTPFDLTPRTEVDQASAPAFPDVFGRRGFGFDDPLFMVLVDNDQVPLSGSNYNCKFCWDCSHNPFFDILEEWTVGFFMDINIETAPTLRTIAQTGDSPTTINLRIRGVHQDRGIEYVHEIPVYTPSADPSHFSGSVTITANRFYEFRDQQTLVPTFDLDTGEQLNFF